MPREASITQNDITRAAIRLLRKGQHPSAQKVRTELGDRGSLSTIHEGLKAWRESLNDSDLDVLPAEMPKELGAPIEDFFNACMAIAESQLAEHRRKANAEIEKAAAEARQAVSRMEDLQGYAKELETKLDGRIEQIDQLKAQNDEIRQQRLEASNLAQQNADRIDSLMSARDNDRKVHEREVDELKRGFERDKEALLQRIKITEDNAAADARKSEKQLDYWILEVDNERTRAKAQAEKDEHAIKRLENELFIARKKEDAMSMKISKTETALMAAQDSVESLERQVTELVENIDAVTQKKERIVQQLQDAESRIQEQQATIQDLTRKIAVQEAGKADGSTS
ncbi:DNA-binding protein [Marinobacter alkaliphilus]|uniref:DNA-binding protein n=1 Tax=Marinobacter alkaliphilus TaxID=254719 RepID=A0ABZ3EB41_9GAMM